MRVEVMIKYCFDACYQFALMVDEAIFFYNSSISDILDVEHRTFVERLLKVINDRKIVKSINEFVFILNDQSETKQLIEDFKNEFVNEMITLSLGGE